MGDTVGSQNGVWAPDVHAWVVVDAGRRLLAVGDEPYPGVPPRSVLSVAACHVLLPRLWQALRDGRSRSEMTQFAGRFVDVAVVVVPGPVTGRPVAVLGCYGANASAFPALPPIAGLEWSARAQGPVGGHRTGWVRDPWLPGAPSEEAAGTGGSAAATVPPGVSVGQRIGEADLVLTLHAVRRMLGGPADALMLRHVLPADGGGPVRVAAWREPGAHDLVRGTVTRLPAHAAAPQDVVLPGLPTEADAASLS